MEFSFDRPEKNQHQKTTDPHVETSANERLRKAIERNRAKQAAREASNTAFKNPNEEPEQKKQAPSLVTRRSVARADDTDFVPVKRTTRKVTSQLSYATSSSRKKAKAMDPKYLNWLIKGAWIFCGVMILRLIFSTGGVLDFYSQKTVVNERNKELLDIKKENMQLALEIEKMKSDVGFQKKLVRDNLGFIGADEFLVLFPKER